LLPYIRPGDDAHAVVVSGAPLLLDKIVQDLQVLDQPPYSCLVKAWIISCADNDRKLHDLMLRLTGGDSSVALDSGGSLSLEYGGQRAEELLAQIRALSAQSHMRIEAAPVVQVANSNWASLFFGQRIYYWKINDNGWSQETVLDSVEAGTRLEITPQTGGEWVTLDVYIENNFLREQNTLGPLVLNRSLYSTMRVRSGETIIIGGLRLDMDERQEQHVPSNAGAALGAEHVSNTQDFWVLLQPIVSKTPVKADQQTKAVGL
jgi:type II secretory pathway component GspD/PulD (secretin)